MSIRELKSIGKFVNLAKQEIAAENADDDDVQIRERDTDLMNYGRMLSAFREMSDIVREHGKQLSTCLEEEPSKGDDFDNDSGQENSREGFTHSNSPAVSVKIEQRTLQALSRVGEELFIDVLEEDRPENHSDSEIKLLDVVASEAEELQLQQRRQYHVRNSTSLLDTRSLVSLAEQMSAARAKAGPGATGICR